MRRFTKSCIRALSAVLLPAVLLPAGAASSAAGCPACGTVLTPTYAEQFAQSDAAVLARWVNARGGLLKDAGVPPITTYEILQVGRGKDKSLKPGARIVLPKYYDGNKDDLYFITGKKPGKTGEPQPDDSKPQTPDLKSEVSQSPQKAPESKAKPQVPARKPAAESGLEWDAPTQLSESAYHYITQAPSPEEPTGKRLRYFIRFFEFPDGLVADDAYNEFAKAEYKHVKSIADAFPRKKLREWLSDSQTPETRIGLYGLMLGLCGTKDDVQLLEKIITDHSKEFRLGIDGIVAGYLLLTGEKGMDLIDRTKFKDASVGYNEMFLAVQGLRIIDTYGEGKVGRDRLKQSFRLMLDHPDIVELILPDLARWKDWKIVDRVAGMYGEKNYDSLGFRKTAIRFLLAASNDKPKDAKQPPPHVVAAEAHLERLRKRDPEVYEHAVNSLL